jgi:hypothetical protein
MSKLFLCSTFIPKLQHQRLHRKQQEGTKKNSFFLTSCKYIYVLVTMELIPASYTDFLHWFKNQTENYWSHSPGTSLNEDNCPIWIHDAKWIGMTDEQIDLTEQRYAITFTPEHREFLRILHTIDRKQKVFEQDGSEEGLYTETSFLRNWLEDDDIGRRLNDVHNEISNDIKTGKMWPNSWGQCPETVEERMKIFSKLYATAPKLIPIAGHKYQVVDVPGEKKPVLSILGTDIVYYGSDFRYYLLNEMRDHLNVYHREYDEEDKVWYWAVNNEDKNLFEHIDKNKGADIPFWKDFILHDWTNDARK